MAEHRRRHRIWSFRPPPTGARGEGVLVVGLGRFGESLARGLHEDMGVDVLAVDHDPAIVQRLAGDLPNVVQCDGTSEAALRQIGAENFDRAVVAIATNIEASVLATLAMKEIGIGYVVAKALSEAHREILVRLGADAVVQPEHDMGRRVAHQIAAGLLDYIEIEEDYALAELMAPEDLIGVPLRDTEVRARYGVTIVSVKPPGGVYTYATENTVLERGEQILVAGTLKDLDRFTRRR